MERGTVTPERIWLRRYAFVLALIALIAVAGLIFAPRTEAAKVRTGLLSQATCCGDRYLAIPEGPGHLVRIDGPAGSITIVSTDAGPALFRQREGRIGDLALGLWLVVCGPPASRGGCRASIHYLEGGPKPTPPSTDVGP